MDLTGYELSRDWHDFAFKNPSKIKPSHGALYFFILEHCNRLGWKEEFGLPTQMGMEAIGIRNWRTYHKALDDIITWGFIKLIERSKNQYSSTKIAIVKNTQADTHYLDNASAKFTQAHEDAPVKNTQAKEKVPMQKRQKQVNSIAVINKLLNQDLKELPIVKKNDGILDDDFFSSPEIKTEEKKEKEIPAEKEKGKSAYVKNTQPDFIDQIILRFKKAYLIYNKREYDILNQGVERKMAGKLLTLYKRKWPEAKSEDCLLALENYFNAVVAVEDDWKRANMSLSLLVSKFNEINNLIKNGRTKGIKQGISKTELAELLTGIANDPRLK